MSKFQDLVLKLVLRIPRGKVTTYGELARALGRPGACRAVGNALARNPYPEEIPCHRVVRSSGEIGGYMLGRDKKAELLSKEGVEVEGGQVDLRRYLWKPG